MNRFIIFLIALSSALALIPSSFSQIPVVHDQPVADPAPTPPLQWVNGSNAQINNNVPITAVPPAYTPTPHAPNQQAQMEMQQQQQVPSVQLPYPLESESPSH